MSAEIIQFSEARLRNVARRRAATIAVSPLLVGCVVCCLPLWFAYAAAIELAQAVSRPKP